MGFLGGNLLVASPYLADRNFLRSVVLIISHDDEHAFGLLLNRAGYDSLREVWQSLTGEVQMRSEMIRTGGPLDGPLMVLHHQSDSADTQIVDGVYLSSTRDNVRQVMQAPSSDLIPVMGYSGWGAGQLEVEMEVGGWMTLSASRDIVFADPAEMWNIASRKISNGILSGVDLRHTPTDPRMN